MIADTGRLKSGYLGRFTRARYKPVELNIHHKKTNRPARISTGTGRQASCQNIRIHTVHDQ